MERYFRLEGYTPYCGEEVHDYIVGQSPDDPHIQECINDLLRETAEFWIDQHRAEWKENGYTSEEEWEEDYYASCGVRIREIDLKTYQQEFLEDDEDWEEDDED